MLDIILNSGVFELSIVYGITAVPNAISSAAGNSNANLASTLAKTEKASEPATVEVANDVEATVPSAPETSDMGVMICIAGLMISIGAFAATKKKSI